MSKEVALALVVGLKFGLNDAEEFLRSVGFCFSDTDKRDIITKLYIIKKEARAKFYEIDDIYDLNSFLSEKGLTQLGQRRVYEG